MERSATDPRESPLDDLHPEATAAHRHAVRSRVVEPRRIVHGGALTRERAALLAAPFQVRSRPNGGIVARLTIPTGGEEVG